MARYMLDEDEIKLIRARCEGTSVIARLDEQDVTDNPPDRLALLERAREEHCWGSDDVDDDAQLSPSDNGCWVQGWLWLYEESDDAA